MYIEHDDLVRLTGKKDQSRRHLGSDVKRGRRVVSLIGCAAGHLHGHYGADRKPILHNA